jgi:hypothetical protein
MGISFLYIGRDEHTLNDRLLLESPSELGFPLEMNVTTSPYRPRGNFSANTSNMTSLQAMLSRFDAATLSSILPPDFNMSAPYVTKPFNPIPYRRPVPNKPNTVPSKPSTVPALPVDPVATEHTMAMLEGYLKKVIPGIPKDFKFSKLYAPGGFIISELEELINGIKQGMGIHDPFEEIFEGGHHLL